MTTTYIITRPTRQRPPGASRVCWVGRRPEPPQRRAPPEGASLEPVGTAAPCHGRPTDDRCSNDRCSNGRFQALRQASVCVASSAMSGYLKSEARVKPLLPRPAAARLIHDPLACLPSSACQMLHAVDDLSNTSKCVGVHCALRTQGSDTRQSASRLLISRRSSISFLLRC
jgi:hypothetical protein